MSNGLKSALLGRGVNDNRISDRIHEAGQELGRITLINSANQRDWDKIKALDAVPYSSSSFRDSQNKVKQMIPLLKKKLEETSDRMLDLRQKYKGSGPEIDAILAKLDALAAPHNKLRNDLAKLSTRGTPANAGKDHY